MHAPRSRITTAALTLALCAACAPLQYPAAPGARPAVLGDPVGSTAVREGGDLVMGLSAEPDRLDPTTSSSLYTRYVMSSICEKLYDLGGPTGDEIVPQLATALPTVSADGLTVTIPVRTGIMFADGTPFDAAAVATTLQRHLSAPKSTRKSEMGPITTIDTPDDATVVLHYSAPFAPITAALADRAGMILSPQNIAELGADLGDHPVCVGPMKFSDRVPQTSITVERDPLYYDAADVHLDTITYRITTDANIRAANLRSGDIQVADSISTQDVDALMGESGIRVLQTGSLGYQAVTFNVGNTAGTGEPPGDKGTPAANDPRVRQAFSAAVDRTTLVNTVFNNWFEAACGPVAPSSPLSSDAAQVCPPHDPEASRKLLTEAGVSIPYRISMQVTNTTDSLRYAQALQASVAEGGFDLQIEPVEYSTLLDVQTRGDFDLLQLGWSGRIDPAGNTLNFLGTGSGSNYSGYSSPAMDDLLTRATQSTDAAVRATLYGQVTTLLQTDDPVVYLYRQRNLTATTTDVVGVQTFPDGVVRLGKAAFVDGRG